MSLLAVLNDVSARLDPAVTVHVGAEWIRQEEAPPRVVWVPKSESYGPPTPQGGDGITNPAPLWTRRSVVECHLWANDFDAAEALLQAVVRSLHLSLTHHSYQVTSGEWIPSDGTTVNLGVVYVLTLEIMIPITRAPDTTTVVTMMPITPQVVTP